MSNKEKIVLLLFLVLVNFSMAMTSTEIIEHLRSCELAINNFYVTGHSKTIIYNENIKSLVSHLPSLDRLTSGTSYTEEISVSHTDFTISWNNDARFKMSYKEYDGMGEIARQGSMAYDLRYGGILRLLPPDFDSSKGRGFIDFSWPLGAIKYFGKFPKYWEFGLAIATYEKYIPLSSGVQQCPNLEVKEESENLFLLKAEEIREDYIQRYEVLVDLSDSYIFPRELSYKQFVKNQLDTPKFSKKYLNSQFVEIDNYKLPTKVVEKRFWNGILVNEYEIGIDEIRINHDIQDMEYKIDFTGDTEILDERFDISYKANDEEYYDLWK